MDFYGLSPEEVIERLRNLYYEYADMAAEAAEDYDLDSRSASKRHRMHRCSDDLRVVERVLEEIGIDVSEF